MLDEKAGGGVSVAGTPRERFRSVGRGGLLVALLLLAGGCATTDIKATSLINPPPKAAFSAYRQIELKPIEIDPPYAGQGANESARNSLQSMVVSRLHSQIRRWNKDPSADATGTLVIEPRITQIKFISTGARIWAGAFAGSSAIVMKAKVYEKESGMMIAEPEFYQHANAYAGAWSVGSADRGMLDRMASLLSEYVMDNYDEARGGKTGATPETLN